MNPDEILAAYLALADFAERDVTASGKVLRDQYLVLATDAARAANRLEMAASLWQRLAGSSPGHPVTRFRDFAEAFRSAETQTHLRELRLEYPPELVREQLNRFKSGASQPTGVVRPFKPPETIAQANNQSSFGGFDKQPQSTGKPLEPLPWRQNASDQDRPSAFSWWYCVILACLFLGASVAWLTYPFWG